MSTWTHAIMLPGHVDLRDALAQVVMRGGSAVALEAMIDRPSAHLDALAEAGVLVRCARLSGNLADVSVDVRRAQLRQLERQMADAALLGATSVWLPVIEADEQARQLVREGMTLLAGYAAARMVRLLGPPWLEQEEVGLFLDADMLDRSKVKGRVELILERDCLTSTTKALLAEIGYCGIVVEGGQSPQTSSRTSSAT
jgi:hypothetical protein